MRRLLWSILCAFTLLYAVTLAVDIPDLGSNDFKTTTAKGVWFVKHFSPTCIHCIQFAPIWERLAEDYHSLKASHNFHFAQVDCSLQGDLCRANNIRAFPTLQLYVDGVLVDTYPPGERTWEKLASYVVEKADTYGKDQIAGEKYYVPNVNGVSVDLNGDMLQKAKDSGEPWFVKFYAPWCGHCQNLAPTWVQLGKELKNQVDVGEVNCVEHPDVCSANNIRGFPTLKLFVRGTEHIYRDDRSLVSLVNFAKKLSQSSVKNVNAEMLQEQLQRDEVAMVYLYDGVFGPASTLIEKVASRFIHGISFYKSNDPKAIQSFGISSADLPAAVIVKDGKHVIYPQHGFSDTTEHLEALSAWIEKEKFPLVSTIGPGNAPELLQGRHILVLAVLNVKDTEATSKFRAMAASNKNKDVLFAQIDSTTWGDYVQKAYSITRNAVPAVIILDPLHERYFNHDIEMARFSLSSPEMVYAALADIMTGRLKGTSMVGFPVKIVRMVQYGFQSFANHWLASTTILSVVGYLLYKRYLRRRIQTHILPIIHGAPTTVHKD